MIKVVDIFAGPGGLGEGFASVIDQKKRAAFELILSIEKDPIAFETLRLRTFFRHFPAGAPAEYYQMMRNEITLSQLYETHKSEANVATERCWLATLGPEGQSAQTVREYIEDALGDADPWVLIGGPPCQAYSLAGRSRNLGIEGYNAENDVRQRLYVEYLQILADHQPAVFIMENVKGLLSATIANERIFTRILNDLQSPGVAIEREGRKPWKSGGRGYRIYSLVEPNVLDQSDLKGAVIRAENHGVPQARHRVILLGVRNDLDNVVPKALKKQKKVSTSSVLKSLPALRSGLSQKPDSAEAWQECLRSQMDRRWANAGTEKAAGAELGKLIRKTLLVVEAPAAGRGGEFVRAEITSGHAKDWYCDDKIEGICHHATRGHMESDLYRYFYAASYASLHGKSPSLQQFPTDLLPDHSSVEEALEAGGGNFSDRFRVQTANRPSTTIVSHISKDGHYYIHSDPLQCRSLTVREAARLQTFPDNYFFYGKKTAQYVQVGNAVPPYLAKQIGEIVLDILQQAGAND